MGDHSLQLDSGSLLESLSAFKSSSTSLSDKSWGGGTRAVDKNAQLYSQDMPCLLE